MTCATLGVTALLLGGCATTQQEAARLRLNSARLRAAEQGISVTRTNPNVLVEHVTLVIGRPGTPGAIAVLVHNRAGTATSDLPIAVRAQTGSHHAVALNAGAGLDYFETHLPSIGPESRLTWVFTTGRHLAPGTRISAVVGTPAPGATTVPNRLPSLQVTPAAARHGSVRLTVRNPTSVPQYQLQVYALAAPHGRVVAAGRATIPHLGTHTSATLTVRLLGAAPGAARVSVEAPPTIFG